MSCTSIGLPVPQPTPVSASKMLMSAASPHTAVPTTCCDTRTGDGPGGPGSAGGVPCACPTYPAGLLSYSRVPGLPDAVYTSAYSAAVAAAAAGQGFVPLGPDPSAFYSPLSSPYDLKDAPEALRSLAQASPYYTYDPSGLSAYPYGYGGMDLNSANRRKNATRENTNTLKAWLYEHRKNPYPTKGEKIMLAIITKMTLTQVSTWFANARRRLKKENKMTWSPRNRPGDEDDDDDAKSDIGVGSDTEGDLHMDGDSHSRTELRPPHTDDEDDDIDIMIDEGRDDDSHRDDIDVEETSGSERLQSADVTPDLPTRVPLPPGSWGTLPRAPPSCSPDPRDASHPHPRETTSESHRKHESDAGSSTSTHSSHSSSSAVKLTPVHCIDNHRHHNRTPVETTTTGSAINNNNNTNNNNNNNNNEIHKPKPKIWSLADTATSDCRPSERRSPPAAAVVHLPQLASPRPGQAPYPPPGMNGLRGWMNGAFPMVSVSHPTALPPHPYVFTSGAGTEMGGIRIPHGMTMSMQGLPAAYHGLTSLAAGMAGYRLHAASAKLQNGPTHPHHPQQPEHTRVESDHHSKPEIKSPLSAADYGDTAFKPVTKRPPML